MTENITKKFEELEENLFRISGDKTSPEFKKQLITAMSYINKFCKKYDIALVKIDVTMEEGYYKPCYAFTDNLGYYTLQGLKNSL
ncbi:hypothetical protein HYV79_03765 [Candidatus Woesearchaeota archaeon]|nr:hypothetical protein [Candidatus Woesearchaeota archaeon]